MHSKVAIIGAGQVGASAAYASVLRRLPATILLSDVAEKLCHGQVLDISDAEFLSSTSVEFGTPKECGQCDIIVITAGARQQPGEPRSDLVGRNYKILKSIIDGMQPIKKTAIMILVSNPVEILTHIAMKISGLPAGQVFGSGTYLDTMRLRLELANHFGVNENAIHAYVVGEHGDRQFVHWSAARVGGAALDSLPESNKLDKDAIAKKVMRKAYDIIDMKGATHFGIGACVASLCESVLRNTLDVRCVSTYVDSEGSILSVPAVIGHKGVVRVIKQGSLDEEERKKLTIASTAIKEMCKDY